jgi:hypothetical protein
LFKLHRGGKHMKAQGTYTGKRQSGQAQRIKMQLEK